MQNEIWKDIPGYAGLYQISNAGRIRAYSKMRGPVLLRPKNLQSRVNKHGYLQKTLVNENGRKTWDIHRLVALTFIPNPENKSCVDHINTNRTDNRVFCAENQNGFKIILSRFIRFHMSSSLT